MNLALFKYQEPNKEPVWFEIDCTDFTANENRSLIWFHERELKRKYPDTLPNKFQGNWMQYAVSIKTCTVFDRGFKDRLDFRVSEVYNEYSVIRLNSLADLYSTIGYDIKKKKYI